MKTKLILKDRAELPEPIPMTDGFWYMLVDGGYIKPESFLESNSAKEVRDAIQVLEDFKELLENKELTYEI